MSEVETEVREGIGWVTLNRPERRNALSTPLLDQLHQTLEEQSRRPDVRLVVVQGAGGHFSVGADLEELAGVPFANGDRDVQIERLLRHSTSSQLLREMPKITVAAVDGACAGAGMGLAMAADFRVISDRAVFKSAFVSAGMSGDFGLAWTLSRLLGDGPARSILLEDPRIEAERAMKLGIASVLVPSAGFATELTRFCQVKAALPSMAVAGIKANLADAIVPFGEALAAESPRHIDGARSDEAAAAARAFVRARSTPG
ncbi:hypothetical protein BHE97_16270 [Aeromicrobium sp. PE09-221]|uniref:enoyl-CoA hydratase/isomerase family protein n=1 Tax=Aeromicrobium sp. PE09-221 TaxID=1898043 RepID=UPI000B6DAC13|nr:enoyl-CoA hydratase/isomerase family protein [Aeromicrobium sp. PE09-221]OUZ07652.1 hypothetical protein BHE97_16270 [Aeromicrobium sp. PE09-221]